MNKFFQRLFLLEMCEIRTRLTKGQIQQRILDFTEFETDYRSGTTKNGFFIAEKVMHSSSFGGVRNSFVPVAKATVTESDGITTVSILFRMNLFTHITFLPFYFISILTLVLLPFTCFLIYIGFLRPKKRLKNHLTELLTDNSIYEE